ncbi:MAG: hypothetical protein Q4F76_07025, partial [Lachnospiraceae bacterium]|nr:hypothetical protein [Lachnospiraceae bacterium]
LASLNLRRLIGGRTFIVNISAGKLQDSPFMRRVLFIHTIEYPYFNESISLYSSNTAASVGDLSL